MSSLPKPVSASRGGASSKSESTETVVHAGELSANHWEIAWRFAVHACVGTLIFATVALPAVGLNWLVEWLQEVHRIDPVIVLGLRLPEYAVFTTDVILFLVFLWKSAKRTIKEL